MKGKNLQPRLLNPGRISFRFDGQIKSFTDKQKLREFTTTKPALQQMLKELLQAGNTRQGKDLQKQTQNKKMVIGTYISIITLNVNRLNAPTKRQRLAEQIQKQDCCLQETHFRPRDTCRLKVRGWKKIFRANVNQKKTGVAILISDKGDFIKDYYKRQARTLHNNQGINPKRRHNNCKYLFTQHRRTSIHKANGNSHKRGN